MFFAGRSHRHGQRVHAAFGEVNPRDRIHICDDRIDGEGVVWGEAGVHRLKGVDALGARVFEVIAHFWSELSKSTNSNEFRQIGCN